MAEQVQSLSGGVTVKYVLTPPDLASIDVKDSAGRTLVYGPTNQNSINGAIVQTNKLLDNTIANSQLDIEIANEEIVQYQAILNDPTSSERSRNRATLGISGNQKDIASANQTITDCNVAKAGINSQGNSILTGLVPKPVPPTPVPTATPTPAPTPAPTPLIGAASDDSGVKQANPAGTTGAPPNQPPSTAADPNPNVSAPNGASIPPNATTGASSATTPTQNDGSAPDPTSNIETVPSKPGRRLKNPLGEFSSYTYQISLYMITPDAYDVFVSGGRKKIDVFNEATAGQDAGGAFLVAQSGGINNTNSKRAPGFDFDYYIDNLELTSQCQGPSTGAATNVTEFKFKIIEPYGFSFINNLKKASDQLQTYAKAMKYKGPENPSKQFFVLGIKFLGYDAYGNIASGDSPFGNGTLDPNSVDGSLFETFYDIIISSIEFKIDGKATVYSCTAAGLAPNLAFGVKKGMTQVQYNVTGSTVGQVLDKLMESINKTQTDLLKSTTGVASTYKIDWSAPGASDIRNASIVSRADLDKTKWAGSGAKTTEQSNAAKETKTKPDNSFRNFSWPPNSSILSIINQVIAQSAYLENALKVVNTTAIESDTKAKNNQVIQPNTNKLISWYNCSTVISNAQWDGKVADWAYNVTYRIQKYETPVVNSVYTSPGKNYYGPHKRYSYWYTGKNSEVLQYEQVLNNAFFNSISPGAPTELPSGTSATAKPEAGTSGNAAKGPNNVAQAPGILSPQPRLGKTGYNMEAPNSYLNSLYDPSSYAEATIKIMGDPDFLMQEAESTEKQIYDQFYGANGVTINPNGGQVFIEIDFKEAVDYGTWTGADEKNGLASGGTLQINDSILFWKYPENVAKVIQGVSYLVREVISTFSNGSFTQVIHANINDFGDPDAEAKKEEALRTAKTERINTAGVGAAPTNNAAAKSSAGTKPAPTFNSANPKLPAANTSNKSPSQPTSTTGPAAKPVADDDGGKG